MMVELETRGRKPGERTRQIGLKITEEKYEQLLKLQRATRWSQTDIVEEALNTFEAAWKRGEPLGRERL